MSLWLYSSAARLVERASLTSTLNSRISCGVGLSGTSFAFNFADQLFQPFDLTVKAGFQQFAPNLVDALAQMRFIPQVFGREGRSHVTMREIILERQFEQRAVLFITCQCPLGRDEWRGPAKFFCQHLVRRLDPRLQ